MAGSAIKVEPLSDEENARMRLLFDSVEKYGQRFGKTKPGNYTVFASYEKHKDRIKNWEFKPDDVCLAVFPKCGTNWMLDTLTLLRSDCDFEKAQGEFESDGLVVLDIPFLFDSLKQDGVPVDKIFASMEKASSPRLIITHLPFSLLPENMINTCKVVLCLRNPKDTVVSKYHFSKKVKVTGYVGDFPPFFDLFMDGLDLYGPYFEFMKEAWSKREHENVCIVFYEDMKKNMVSCLRKLAKFLGKDFTDEVLEKAADYLDFANTKKRNVSRPFLKMLGKPEGEGSVMRKGVVGDWKNHFTDDMIKRMDEAIEKHLKPIGLEFNYE